MLRFRSLLGLDLDAVPALLCVLLLWLWAQPAQAQASPLAVTATYDASGAVVVTWSAPPAGTVSVCVIGDAGSRCPGPAATSWRQAPSDHDVRLYLEAGDLVEVRAYDAGGELVAVGRGRVERRRVWVPVAHR